MRFWLAALSVAFALTGASATARPFSVEDLLRQEQVLGQVVDPRGRWLVFEKTDPYDSAPRFDHDLAADLALTRLYRVDLHHPSPARPLLSPGLGPGESLGPLSPSGRSLAVFRLSGRRWRLGVVKPSSGKVRWFAVTPERSGFGRPMQWLNDRTLLVIDRPGGRPDFALRQGRISADTLPTLWAIAARGGATPTVNRSGGYTVDRPRPPPRHLLKLDTRTGGFTVLATGEFTDLEVSPDQTHVGLLEAGEDIQPQADGPSQGDWGTSTTASHLTILDLKTGVRWAPVAQRDVLSTLMSWSPDGSSLLILTRAPRSGWSTGVLQRVDVRSTNTSSLAEGLSPALNFRPEVAWATWMGGDPVLYARPKGDPTGRADWYRLSDQGVINLTRNLPDAPRAIRAIDADGLSLLTGSTLWRLDRVGGATRFADDILAAVHEPRPPAGRSDLAAPSGSWLITGRPDRQAGWFDANGAGPALALPPAGDAFAVAPGGHAALIHDRDVHGVETLRVVRPDAPLVTVATWNEKLADVTPDRVVAIPHLGPDGQALTSWLFLPANAPPGKPPPLVVQVYAGSIYRTTPRTAPGILGFATDIRVLTGHGYAVLMPSLPNAKAPAEPMGGLAAQILNVVDAAAAKGAGAGTFDPTRIALWGHSYGGFTAMAAIGQTDRFSAAVSIAGFSDQTALWSALPVAHRTAPEEGSWSNWNTGNTESGQNRMGVPPWRDPARYQRNSPLLAANQINTPLLLFHGDQDLIPLAQSEAMFSALYRQDKDALQVTYWGEGHYISSPGNVRDLYERAFAFLDTRLRFRPAGPGEARRANPGPGSASSGPRTP